jgi:hypothetical protein
MMRRAMLLAGAAAMALIGFVPDPVQAQSDDQLRLLRLGATPIGALPQLSLPMPAHRGRNYWGARLQTGQRRAADGSDLIAVAGGIDLQLNGGSVFGLTAGYQERACEFDESDCGGHAMFGARARMNFITGSSRIGTMLGDNSSTAGLGVSVGLGYAPRVLPDVNACTVDVGLPLSMSMLQQVRIVAYATPAIVWDLSCEREARASPPNYLAGFGIGVQQLFLRGLDVHLGAQRIFRRGAGHQIGISVTYIHLP